MNFGVALSFLEFLIEHSRALIRHIDLKLSTRLAAPCIISAGLLATTKISAQSNTVNPTASTTVKQTPRVLDYTPAINELIKLGFPNIRNAKDLKYVKVADNNLEYSAQAYAFLTYHSPPENLTGNGFFIPSKDASKANKFIYMAGLEMLQSSSKKGPLSRTKQSEITIPITNGKVTDADLKKDLETLTKWAIKFPNSSDYQYGHEDQYPIALGYAILAHQAGMEDEATKLIKILFLDHQNPEQLVDSLINKIAITAYNQAYTTFQLNQDWKAYRDALLDLQEKFPRGWRNQPGLSILIPQLNNQINKNNDFIPIVAGHTFSPEIQRLFLQLTDPPKKNQNQYYNTNLFLINKPQKDTSVPALIQLTQHGMEGFLALAALIDDPRLVLPMQVNGRGYDRSSYSYSSNDDPISPEQAYASLNKPQTVGSLAQSLITSNLPHNQEVLSSLEPRQIRDLAIEWWKKHHDDTRLELLENYLEQGNRNHQYQIISSLEQENTEDSLKMMEKYILSSESPSSFTNSVQNHVKKRKAKAADFLTQYEKAVKNEININGEDRIEYRFDRSGGHEKFFSELSSYTKEIDPDKLLKQLSESDENLPQNTTLLISSYDGKYISEYINPLIKITADKKSPTHQYQILSALIQAAAKPKLAKANNKSGASGLLKALLGGHKRQKGKEAAAAKSFILTPEEKSDWEKLLQSNKSYQGYKISQLAGVLLDKSAHPELSSYNYDSLYYLGPKISSGILTSRSKAILEGTEAPPLPDIKSVTTERTNEMFALLEKTEPIGLNKIYQSFNNAEKIKLYYSDKIYDYLDIAAKYIQGFDEGETEFQPKNLASQKEILQPFIGKEITQELLLKLALTLSKNADSFSSTSISLDQSYAGLGSYFYFGPYKFRNNPYFREAEEELKADKIKAFTFITLYDLHTGKREFITVNENTTLESEQVKSLSTDFQISFTAVNKSNLKKFREKSPPADVSRAATIKRIIEEAPDFRDLIEGLDAMDDEQLNQLLEDITGDDF